MSMSAAELRSLAHHEHWDTRYAEVGPNDQVHEWFRSYDDLKPFFEKHLFQLKGPQTAPRILHMGSGDSSIPEDLSKVGYRDQICLDFSSVIVRVMSLKHENIEGIMWKHADVRCMNGISSESIDVAFDKGTLDAMIHGSPWDPPDEVLENSGRYIREVFRVLKSTGMFLYVTYRQPHFMKPLLSCEGSQWSIEVEILGGADSSFEYFGFILRKAIRPATQSAGAGEGQISSTDD